MCACECESASACVCVNVRVREIMHAHKEDMETSCMAKFVSSTRVSVCARASARESACVK